MVTKAAQRTGDFFIVYTICENNMRFALKIL